jgi:hypothetical protein
MTKLKINIILKVASSILTVLLFTSCSEKSKNTKEGFYVTANFGGEYRIDTNDYINIVGQLHNQSKGTISFISMTCSWANSWKVSSKSFSSIPYPCFSNVPFLQKLGPDEKITYYFSLRLDKPRMEILDEKFTVGFNLVKADTVIFDDAIKKLTETNNFYWSDTLQMNEFLWYHNPQKEPK